MATAGIENLPEYHLLKSSLTWLDGCSGQCSSELRAHPTEVWKASEAHNKNDPLGTGVPTLDIMPR